MKLRNKKTGEIAEPFGICIIGKNTFIQFEDEYGKYKFQCNSLAQLNKEWEDYEEPKGSALDLMILTLINFIENEPDEDKVDLEDCKQMLEKLEAWKRLKDTYFIRFDLDFVKNTINFTYRIGGTLYSSVNEERIIFEDMKTIFGGKHE